MVAILSYFLAFLLYALARVYSISQATAHSLSLAHPHTAPFEPGYTTY